MCLMKVLMTSSILYFQFAGLVVDEENVCKNSLQVGTNDKLDYKSSKWLVHDTDINIVASVY